MHEGFFIFDGCPDGLEILSDGSVIQQFCLLSRSSLNDDYIFRRYKKSQNDSNLEKFGDSLAGVCHRLVSGRDGKNLKKNVEADN